MAQRRSLAWTELRVGILVTVSFLLLALGIFYVGGTSSFWTPKYKIVAYFASANGLRPGGEVWLEGVTVGGVNDVRISRNPDPSKAVEIEMEIENTYQNIIRSDSQVSIETKGLLGDNIVDITRGTAAGQVVPDGGTLQGEEAGDIKKIITGTNDFIANLDTLSETFKRMADKVDKGEGTLGKLMSDTAIYDNFNNTTTELNALVKDAHTGNGTIGRLISDDTLHTRIVGTVDRVNKMMDNIEAGNGSIGKFYKDPSIANRTDALLASFQTISDDINQGKGTIGKLAKDEALWNDTRAVMARVNHLIDAMENGEGTIGKAIKDPTLFNTINQTSSEIMKLLYDFRQNPKKFLTINFKLF
jgi:phospholipid/cholesterol/gamma-HCH transport system substrate-binding protein